jgi:2-iminobutanoate/2-iminopropanoate deaminase
LGLILFNNFKTNKMKTFNSEKAPKALGPYSQAIRTGNLLFCSGQTPVNPKSMLIEKLDITNQTLNSIRNLEIVLNEAGLKLSDVVKTTVFLTDMADFKEMNATYENCFGIHRPARSTVAVSGLPANARVEIECIAEFND